MCCGQIVDEGERLVFERISLNYNRALYQDCANFYLLERMVADGFRQASRTLATLERSLTRDFMIYLDLAIGGEIRHLLYARYEHGIQPSDRLWDYVKRNRDPNPPDWCNPKSTPVDRTTSWNIWLDEPDHHLLIADSIEAFTSDEWPERTRVAGPAWGTVAKVYTDKREGRISDRLFIDRCFTLEHNNGCVMNKAFHKLGRLRRVLEIQEFGDYNKLANRYASEDVSWLWQQNLYAQRGEFDSEWLGR